MRWQRSLRLATVFQAMSGSMLGSEPPPQRRGAPSERSIVVVKCVHHLDEPPL